MFEVKLLNGKILEIEADTFQEVIAELIYFNTVETLDEIEKIERLKFI